MVIDFSVLHAFNVAVITKILILLPFHKQISNLLQLKVMSNSYSGFQEYDIMYFGRWSQTFRRNTQPPTLATKSLQAACTNRFKTLEFTFFPHCIYLFCIYLRTNNDFCTI